MTRPEMATPSKVSATARFKVKQRLTPTFLWIDNSTATATTALVAIMREARTARITPNGKDDSISGSVRISTYQSVRALQLKFLWAGGEAVDSELQHSSGHHWQSRLAACHLWDPAGY